MNAHTNVDACTHHRFFQHDSHIGHAMAYGEELHRSKKSRQHPPHLLLHHYTSTAKRRRLGSEEGLEEGIARRLGGLGLLGTLRLDALLLDCRCRTISLGSAI